MRSFKRIRERPGSEMPWPGATPPPGWLLQDGALYNVADYPALASVLGATYGGDGVATFAVPDMRGRVPVGVDGGAGRVTGAAANLGGVQGAQSHTLSTTEMPSHNHGGVTNTTGAHTHTGANVSGLGWVDYGSGGYKLGSTGSSGNHAHTITAQGGSGAHNNMQPSIGKNWIIKF